jgi:integrase/recombinase XerD
MVAASALYRANVSKEKLRTIHSSTDSINNNTLTVRSDSRNDHDDVLFDRKVETASEGLISCFSRCFYNMPLKNNALTLADYIIAMKSEINLADNYRKEIIQKLAGLSIHHGKTLFKDMTREQVLEFLDSLRKPEASDPLHKWIGTYNVYRMHIVRFFKWLYHPDIEPQKRPKPSVVENIPQLKRKEVSIYKPSDLWTNEDDAIFLRYCPSKRMKCYHAVSRDTSCRPHEILKLRIKDIVFKTVASNHYQYAEVLVNGKTGSRHLPLIDSIPYVKDWLDHEHPQSSNPNCIFLCGFGKSLGRALSTTSLRGIYEKYRQEFFPKLLESPNVPPEDKAKIKELLQKPWNPYIRRHSALTQKSTMLKEHILRQHAGWSGRSQMHLKYLHYFGNESSESLLEAYGIIPKEQQSVDILRPKQCPNCAEPNKPDSKFCVKCRMVLTYDAYNETLEKQQKYEQDLKLVHEEMNQRFSQIMSMIQQNPKLAHVKPEVLITNSGI